MAHFKSEVHSNKEMIQYRYEGISKDAAVKELEKIFMNSMYKSSIGTGGHTNFEKGDRTMRILFGAFVKYYKFAIISEETDNNVDLKVVSVSSGLSGGLIGKNQVTDEMIRISQLMKQI